MKNKRAFALIFALLITLLITLTVSAIFTTTYNEFALAGTESNAIRAYYLAEAGLSKKFMQLRENNTSALSESFSIATGISGNYSVSVTLVQGGIFSTYRLDSTGTYKNINKAISITLSQISCARFAYLSNDEDQMFWYGTRPIWFVTGDLLTGPLHSNDQLNISGDPIFDGPVSSSASSINYYHGGPPDDNPEFRESLTLGAPNIQLPSSTEIINNIKTAAQQADGLYLTGNSVVTLLPDGTMNVTNSLNGWNNQNMSIPVNDSVFVQDGYVDVSGTLSGQLTIGTNRNIYVVNNVLYSNDPRVDPSSADMLGLVAQNNIYVDTNAPYDLEIDAYMVALNTSFSVEDYATDLKGTLTIYGGLTQYRRGPIGTFYTTTNEKASGYTKDYAYDGRFANMAPAYFPPAKDSNNRLVYIKTSWAEY